MINFFPLSDEFVILSVWHAENSCRSKDLDAFVQDADAAVVERQQPTGEQLRLVVVQAADDADDFSATLRQLLKSFFRQRQLCVVRGQAVVVRTVEAVW